MMNQTFRDKPKATTPNQSYTTAARSPSSHEVGGTSVDRTPDRTPDLLNIANSPGNIRQWDNDVR